MSLLSVPAGSCPTTPAALRAGSFHRFSLLQFPLEVIDRAAFHTASDQPLGTKAARTRFPFRLLRYWWPTAALAQQRAAAGRRLRVLDAGCQGGFLRRFAGPSVDAHWTGLDWDLSNPHLPKAGYDAQVQADLNAALPLEEAAFDAVVSLHVFEHLRLPEQTLREYARVVRPGGRVLLAFPTMPGWLAPFREASHRREIRQGKRPVWGHQQVFHPYRCEAMAFTAGLEVEMIAGSHFFRKTGLGLESQRWWVRLNQAWGAAFPSLGSELCVILRKPQ